MSQQSIISEKKFKPRDKFWSPVDKNYASLQSFNEVPSGKWWAGKCGPEAVLFGSKRCYKRELQGWLGLKLYELFGVPIPGIALSFQIPNVSESEKNNLYDLQTPCLHLMWNVEESFFLGGDFIERYRKISKDALPRLQPSLLDERSVSVRGFGSALAVAFFLYDRDWLGEDGRNLGYMVQRGGDDAQVTKLNAESVFYFLKHYGGQYLSTRSSTEGFLLCK
jgi:hypothetical protein